MNSKKTRIVFFGTPDFAVPSLESLFSSGYAITAVVTAPDKPAGRGLKIRYSPVKEFALKNDIPVLQPERLKNPDFLEEFKMLNADLGIVVAFRILPEEIWSAPPLGTINLHASLLPQYRGAAPINRAIINGEKETGATTFFLRKEVDTGGILFSSKIPIGENETAGELHDRLKSAGAELLLKTVSAIENKTYKVIEQSTRIPDENSLKKAPKIFPEQCEINWDRPVENVHNFIRGLSPHPGAYTYFVSTENSSDKKFIKIYRSRLERESHSLNPGDIITDGMNLKVAAQNGFIRVLELQQSGKRVLQTEEFLKGYRVPLRCIKSSEV